MRKHHNQLMLMASKERVNMANKHNKITMQMVQPNMEYWSKYINGNKPKEIFIPMKEHGSLHREIKSSENHLLLKTRRPSY
jgi:hypothetical protein